MIVKFTQHSGYTYYYTDWDGDMSGEYVPLAEYHELQDKDLALIESLAKEIGELTDKRLEQAQKIIELKKQLK